MASVLRNRGAGSGGFSGVYAPAFVPGSSHASADYIPGYFCTPNGPVYGMYVPSIAQSIAQTAPLLPSPAAAAQPFDQLPPHWIPPPPTANPPAAASVSNTGESGNGDPTRSGHPAQGSGGEAQARAAAADQAQQLLARVVITDLIRIRPASFFRRVVSELIDLCVISLLLVLVLGDSMIELIDKMEELDPSSTSAHELEAALFKHADVSCPHRTSCARDCVDRIDSVRAPGVCEQAHGAILRRHVHL
eukprot:m.274791 g.274791  ORF g.274791 m.274791 type:complete len:248 (+) comp16135_c0_seq7:2018-2761(+)